MKVKVKEKIPKFVRVYTKNAVIIIPIDVYIAGIDFENFGIATEFIEEKDLNLFDERYYKKRERLLKKIRK